MTHDRRKLISIVNPCYNEIENIDELCLRTKAVMQGFARYEYEQVIIDNASTDGTQGRLRELAAADPHIKVILNTRNFGHIRSPYHALMQARGDAVLFLASDLQDPPEMIEKFINEWEKGIKVVVGVKPVSKESPFMFFLRRVYYNSIGRISDIQLIPNFTGFGLYDREVMDNLRKINDPYPYFRGLIAELGYPYTSVPFEQPRRIRGITKNNFYTLYDIAMLGITSHSKLPLRIATMAGFVMAFLCMLIAAGYMAAKLLFWNDFNLGVAPIVIGFFFFTGIQLFFIGLLGEYIGSIHTTVRSHPHVIEMERINF